MNIEVWTTGRPVKTERLVLVAAVALLLALAFAAGWTAHGHGRRAGGCPKCDAVYELGYDAGFEAGMREATIDWKEWR